jgi:hypothetical protein
MVMIMDSLIEDLFSLDEPWRGRFLNLVATRATMRAEYKQQPTPEEVSAWFRADPYLRRRVSLLLYAWQGARRQHSRLERALAAEHCRDGS